METETKPEPTSPESSQKKSENLPYSYGNMFALSILFGLPGASFILWRNFIRIGKPEMGQKFLFGSFGGLVLFVLLTIYIEIPGIQYLAQAVGWAVVIWFNNTYLKPWEKANPELKPKFAWSMVGWGLLGLVAFFVAVFILAFISALIFPKSV